MLCSRLSHQGLRLAAGLGKAALVLVCWPREHASGQGVGCPDRSGQLCVGGWWGKQAGAVMTQLNF